MNHRAGGAPGGARRSLICAVFGNCWSFPSLLAFICSLGLKAGSRKGGMVGGRSKRALRAWSSRPIFFFKYQHLSGASVCNGLLVLEERMVRG